MSEEINIPSQVVDEEAYAEYQKYNNMSKLQLPGRLIETSDIYTTIDPLTKQNIIDDKIKHLPFKEKGDIMKKVKICRTLHRKMLTVRAKAYGKRPDSMSVNTIQKEQMKMVLDERSSEIMEYFGRYMDINEILKIVHNEWGLDVHKQYLQDFKANNKKKITAIQESFRKDLNDSKLYHKRYRLEELAEIYQDRKVAYKGSKSREDVKLMMAILRQAKDEAEINQLHISGEITHKIEMTINEHIEREIMGGLIIQDIILARVAHRMKVDPTFLINRLHTSIYSKFTGFGTPDNSLMEDEIIYPSTMVYDWDKIKKQQDINKEIEKEYSEFEEMGPKEAAPLLSIKDELKKKLAEKRSNLNKIQKDVDKNAEE